MRPAFRRALAAASAVGLAATGIAVTATTASADLVTLCRGEAQDVTVPGDLRVPAGSVCVLENVTITGQVAVAADADLIVMDSTINGAVFVNSNGYFDANNSSMEANVTNRAGWGVFLEDSSVGGGYFGRDFDGGDDTYVYGLSTAFQGRVQVEQGEIYLDSSQVSGHVETTGTTYTDVLNSTLERTLTVSGSDEGSHICASEVDGLVTFTGNGPVELGTGVTACDEVNYFGSDVVINDTSGGVDVTGNIIRGDLTGEGNDPAPTGSDNRVRGELAGQFTDLQPAEPSMSMQQDTEPSPSDLVQDKRDERRGMALEEAEEIGPANL